MEKQGADVSGPQKLNQIEYVKLLKAKRPDLIASACKENLVVKPQYRAKILAGRDSYATLIAREYSENQKFDDKNWSDSQRKMAQQLKAKPDSLQLFSVADYPPEWFVGYKVGKGDQAKYGSGREYRVVYKVFFELASFATDLTAESYVGFTRALAAASFSGDSKILVAPGSMRFKFNNIVIHARTKKDALIAESVGKEFFKGKLSSIARGLDVFVASGTSTDWNQFLCEGDLAKLSEESIRFTLYKD